MKRDSSITLDVEWVEVVTAVTGSESHLRRAAGSAFSGEDAASTTHW